MDRLFTVEKEFINKRLDYWLAQKTELSRAQIKRYFHEGYILFQRTGHPITTLYKRLSLGEVYLLRVAKPTSLSLKPVAMPFDICFEDEHLVVIHKPPGIAVHPGPNQTANEKTLIHGLLAKYSDLPKERWGIVHRLDKDTEGLMIIAKSESACQELVADFANRRIRKRYLAWSSGYLQNEKISGKITTYMSRHPRQRLKMRVSEEGKLAETIYRALTVMKIKSGFRYYRIRLAPKTGRTHQIRVHLAHLGIPIVNDNWYAHKRSPRGLRYQKQIRELGLLLFAQELRFYHPIKRKWLLKFTLPQPQRFNEFEKYIQEQSY